jgi:hypothetical protein
VLLAPPRFCFPLQLFQILVQLLQHALPIPRRDQDVEDDSNPEKDQHRALETDAQQERRRHGGHERHQRFQPRRNVT